MQEGILASFLEFSKNTCLSTPIHVESEFPKVGLDFCFFQSSIIGICSETLLIKGHKPLGYCSNNKDMVINISNR